MSKDASFVSCFHVITIHPDFIHAYGEFGVFASYVGKGLGSINVLNLRDHAIDQRGSIDDKAYGGGDSMVMRIEPLAAALRSLPQKPHVILTSPRGRTFDQKDAQRLSRLTRPLAFVCGRFAGIDQRFIDQFVDEEMSAGDLILSGGELPALMMMDATLRLIPGVLGNDSSSLIDSFSAACQGGLEYPLYTRPAEFEGMTVPEVLLSGHQRKIEEWRRQQAELLTRKMRPDLVP